MAHYGEIIKLLYLRHCIDEQLINNNLYYRNGEVMVRLMVAHVTAIDSTIFQLINYKICNLFHTLHTQTWIRLRLCLLSNLDIDLDIDLNLHSNFVKK